METASWLPSLVPPGRGKLTIRYVPGRDGLELERLVAHLEAVASVASVASWQGEIIGKPWGNHRETMGKCWENAGKMVV